MERLEAPECQGSKLLTVDGNSFLLYGFAEEGEGQVYDSVKISSRFYGGFQAEGAVIGMGLRHEREDHN